jgi:hypothetical protein
MSTPASPTSWCPPPAAARPSQDRRQLIGCVKGSLAHLRWRPLLVTGLCRQVLINHFSSPDFIEDPDLVDAVWTDGPRTGILIESVFRWVGSNVEKRPAVLVKPNAYKTVRLAINDLYSADGQGFDHYLNLKVGSHTLFCIGGSGASCEILTTEAEREIDEFGPVIRQQLGLDKFQVTEVGPLSIVEESRQAYVRAITVAWAYQHAWKIESEARPLQGFDLNMTVRDALAMQG